MPVTVKLSAGSGEPVRRHAQVRHRSIPKRIAVWSPIGKTAEENPELPEYTGTIP
ncbi:MAG: TA system antitoxin ParD family protein [Methylococcales bacterium]